MSLKNILIEHPLFTNFKFLFACYSIEESTKGRDNLVKNSLILKTEKDTLNMIFEVAFVDLLPSLQERLKLEIEATEDTNVCFRIFNLINGNLIAEDDSSLNELVHAECDWSSRPSEQDLN